MPTPRLRWPDGLDPRVAGAAATAALVIVLYQLRGAWLPFGRDASLRGQAISVGIRLALYVVVPLGVARAFRLGAGELGLSGRGSGAYVRRLLPLYAGLWVAMLPLAWIAAGTAAFQRVYPQCKQAADGAGYLLAWWGLYALSLLSVELFYRGFMLGMLRAPLGRNAIPVSMLAYAVAHSGKPIGEALGAIVTGSLLGWLAFESRSIWLGWALHCAVAFSLEAMVLLRR